MAGPRSKRHSSEPKKTSNFRDTPVNQSPKLYPPKHVMLSIEKFQLCRVLYLGKGVTDKECWQGSLQISLLLEHVLFG